MLPDNARIQGQRAKPLCRRLLHSQVIVAVDLATAIKPFGINLPFSTSSFTISAAIKKSLLNGTSWTGIVRVFDSLGFLPNSSILHDQRPDLVEYR